MAFSGKRLRDARLYRNLTISELADKIDGTRQDVSRYEKNRVAPKPEVLFKIITALRFPVDFFTEEDKDDIEIENTFFRSLNSEALTLSTQEVKAKFIMTIYNFLENYINFPLLDLPSKDKLSNLSPKEAASFLRRYWKLGEKPIESLVALLEKKGIVVTSIKREEFKTEAFTQINRAHGRRQYCIVLGSDSSSLARVNFDVAHELGHIILHEDFIPTRELSKEEFEKIESEAQEFAVSLLLPEEPFRKDLMSPTDVSSYIYFKKKWKVSILEIMMRAKNLEIINEDEYAKLMKDTEDRQWLEKEPFDDIWEIPRPQLFKKAIEVLKESNTLCGNQIVMELSKQNHSMDGKEIEILLDLDPGALAKEKEEKDTGVLVHLEVGRNKNDSL